MKILICDGLHKKGLRLFEKAKGIDIEVHERLEPEALIEKIGAADALVIRSRTTVDRNVLAAGPNLRVVGRAGTGVDNIDITAATDQGVLVMNTPGANAMAAAEHTMALMLTLARHVSQADQSLRAGKWEKKKFMGTELYNHTLGIIGLGRIGSIVAERAQGFHMRVLAYDPYVSKEMATRLGIDVVPLDKLLQRADFITLHTPLSKETVGLLNEAAFKKMKRGVRIINCARGGLIDEQALYDAIISNKVAGAALDAFSKEPPVGNPLLTLPQVVATPHLGASSEQAQINVATAIAGQMIDYLTTGVIRNAVNVPSVSSQMMEQLRPYMLLAERLGAFVSQCLPGNAQRLDLAYGGTLWELERGPITQAALKGFLERALDENVNLVNAPAIMRHRGIEVREASTSEVRGYTGLITLTVVTDRGDFEVAGSVFPDAECRIVRINEYRMEAPLVGRMLLIANYDRAGVIGIIGTTLGSHGVNIADMHLSRSLRKGRAISLVTVDDQVPQATLKALRDYKDIIRVDVIEL